MSEVKYLLDKLAIKYNCPEFIHNDPISIPHRFAKKEDIEISAFLSAIIAWGKRSMIINNAEKLMNLMHNNPHYFILNATKNDLKNLSSFKHRTFNDSDCLTFINSLKHIYKEHGGLHSIFSQAYKKTSNIAETIYHVRTIFFSYAHEKRSEKHFSDTSKKSAAKRINMFLRWMVRDDKNGVDFGLWKDIPMNSLLIPLDVHSGTTARKLGLLNRKQNDLTAVYELTNLLKTFDPNDPVKYDFALFGAGVNNDLF